MNNYKYEEIIELSEQLLVQTFTKYEYKRLEKQYIILAEEIKEHNEFSYNYYMTILAEAKKEKNVRSRYKALCKGHAIYLEHEAISTNKHEYTTLKLDKEALKLDSVGIAHYMLDTVLNSVYPIAEKNNCPFNIDYFMQYKKYFDNVPL